MSRWSFVAILTALPLSGIFAPVPLLATLVAIGLATIASGFFGYSLGMQRQLISRQHAQTEIHQIGEPGTKLLPNGVPEPVQSVVEHTTEVMMVEKSGPPKTREG